jgi:hypothetical protein
MVVLFFFALGYLTQPACVTPPKPVVTDDACNQAQAALNRLECRIRMTPKGVPFEDVCRHFALQQIDIGVACIITSTTCEQAEKCK